MECITTNQMRKLWMQHVYWTRLLIIGILQDLKDLQATKKRLLENPIDLGMLLDNSMVKMYKK